MAKGDFNGDELLRRGRRGARVRRSAASASPGRSTSSTAPTGGLSGGPLFVQSNPESSDGFGGSLAAGDFNGDGFFDLAVGAAGENVGTVGDAGAVTVLFGVGRRHHHGRQPDAASRAAGRPATAESGRQLRGRRWPPALLAGDVPDLVVGVPGEDVGTSAEAGAVNVLGGSAGGLVNGSLATQGNPERRATRFGLAVATGDFDDTGRRRRGRRRPRRDGERPAGRRRGQRVQRPAERAGQRAAAVPGDVRHPGHGRDRATASGRRWRRPTATASASGTWPSASPARTSGPTRTPGRSTCWPGRPPARAGAAWCCRPTPRTSTAFGEAIAGGFFLHDFDTNGFFDLAVAPPARRWAPCSRPGRSRVFEASGRGRGRQPRADVHPGRRGPGGTAEAFDVFGFALE